MPCTSARLAGGKGLDRNSKNVGKASRVDECGLVGGVRPSFNSTILFYFLINKQRLVGLKRRTRPNTLSSAIANDIYKTVFRDRLVFNFVISLSGSSE